MQLLEVCLRCLARLSRIDYRNESSQKFFFENVNYFFLFVTVKRSMKRSKGQLWGDASPLLTKYLPPALQMHNLYTDDSCVPFSSAVS